MLGAWFTGAHIFMQGPHVWNDSGVKFRVSHSARVSFQGPPLHKTVYDLETSLALEDPKGESPLQPKASVGLLAVEEITG